MNKYMKPLSMGSTELRADPNARGRPFLAFAILPAKPSHTLPDGRAPVDVPHKSKLHSKAEHRQHSLKELSFAIDSACPS